MKCTVIQKQWKMVTKYCLINNDYRKGFTNSRASKRSGVGKKILSLRRVGTSCMRKDYKMALINVKKNQALGSYNLAQ